MRADYSLLPGGLISIRTHWTGPRYPSLQTQLLFGIKSTRKVSTQYWLDYRSQSKIKNKLLLYQRLVILFNSQLQDITVVSVLSYTVDGSGWGGPEPPSNPLSRSGGSSTQPRRNCCRQATGVCRPQSGLIPRISGSAGASAAENGQVRWAWHLVFSY